MPCKVLIVDDSALVRNLLTTLIDAQPDMVVVGTASDPYIARERIKSLNPDVLTLDVEMPRMDGLSFLEKLMRLRPMPVVMVSSLTERSSETTLRALELGAVDYVTKPKIDIINGIHESGQEIVDKIRVAVGVRVKNLVRRPAMLQVEKKHTADVVLPSVNKRLLTTEKVVIVGASTGGTEAIKEFLVSMPADAPGILITQHMPAALPVPLPVGLTASVALQSKKPRMVSGSCRGMPTLHRRPSSPAGSIRCQLCYQALGRSSGLPSPSLGGCALSLCGQLCR